MSELSRLDRMRRVSELEGERQRLAFELRGCLRQLRVHRKRLEEVDELPSVPPAPALPDSHLTQPLPSTRVRFGSSWDEGAPKPPVKHRVE